MCKRHLLLLLLLLIPFSLVSCDGEESADPTAVPPTDTTAPETNNPTPTLASALPTPALSEPTASAANETPSPATTPSTPTAVPSPTTPPTIPPATIEVDGAILPPGFSLVRFADIYRPTSLTAGPDGRIYATSANGSVHLFIDQDGDGRADVDSTFFSGFNIPLGITIRPGTEDVYVSSNTKISILRDPNGDLVAEEAVNFASDLPIGLHQNDNLKFGPDGLLYIGIGSTCDVCVEEDPRSASIMRFDPESGQGEIYATGLRNPYDLAFHPETGDLFATDNGRDDLGLETPQEELNHIVQGADYGWPDCWDEGEGPGCAGTTTAVAFFATHSSANSVDFYDGDRFPAEYRHNAFVTILGSWLKSGVQTGIIRVQLSPDGSTYQGQTAWFLELPAGMMPLGLIIGPDGALYFGDYINGGVYRISYGLP